MSQEGQQFRFGQVSVSSDLPEVDVPVFQNAVALRSGRVYSPAQVDKDIARLERLAIREGLNFVRVEPRITRNDRALALDIDFQLTRGPRIFVETIDIEGNTTTLDRVIRRQFRIVEGDPFNPREIRESAERIRALGFFANAEVEAREGSSPQQVVVDVNVEEQPTGSISFGGSYSSSSGFGLAIQFRERNFLGRGQGINLGFNTASSSRSYSFGFREPALLGRDLEFGIGLSYTETDNENAGLRHDDRSFLALADLPDLREWRTYPALQRKVFRHQPDRYRDWPNRRRRGGRGPALGQLGRLYAELRHAAHGSRSDRRRAA